MNKIVEKFAISFTIVFSVLVIFVGLGTGLGKLVEYINQRFGEWGTVVFVIFVVSLVLSTIWVLGSKVPTKKI